MMCDSRLFQPQIIEFSKEYTVCVTPAICFDSIEKMSAEILKSLPSKFNLIGLSMGGILAMEIIKKASERVMKIVLMDTNYKSETSEIKSKRLPQINLVNEGRLEDVMKKQIEHNYLRKGIENKKIKDLCLSMANDLGGDIFINQSKALISRNNYKKTLMNIKVPSLIICGKYDRLCPIEVHEDMKNLIDNSTFEIIANSGHLPTLEQPLSTNKILKKWLEK